MRMNLKTFEIFVTSLLIVSLIGILSILPGVRYICTVLVLVSLFLLYEIGREEKRKPFFIKEWRGLYTED